MLLVVAVAMLVVWPWVNRQSTELRDPMLRIEFVDPMLQRDVVGAIPSSFLAHQAFLVQGPVEVARAGFGDEDNGSAARERTRERQ